MPIFAHSHQQGHLAAAAWSAGHLELLDRPLLAWHLSGGTTELLLVRPDGITVQAEIIGGTEDISAGQLIDRTGVRLGLDFPAGKAVDQLSRQAHKDLRFPVKLREFSFSLSGMENKMEQLVQGGADPADVARFTLNVVCDTVAKVTERAMERHPGLPVLCSGGVASNAQLREVLTRRCSALFAQPQYSTDNAMGTAILTWRALERQEGRL